MADLKSQPLKVYVGWDSREEVAYDVCRSSLLRRAEGIEVYPIKQASVRELGLYTRSIDASASTEFSLTRFLTPHLAATDGWCLFVDCDFIFTCDVRNVLKDLDPTRAVYVVKHDYVPRHLRKMDNVVQTVYPRKNWSSFVLFNGAHPDVRALTPETVNTMAPSYLHQFKWIADDNAIGALDVSWNFLVGEYDAPISPPNAIHFTNGGPWFPQWTGVDFADLWEQERRNLNELALTRPL